MFNVNLNVISMIISNNNMRKCKYWEEIDMSKKVEIYCRLK